MWRHSSSPGTEAGLPADASNPQRYYECFIPASGAPITDLDLHGLSDSLEPSYVNFTVILDSCNSGGIHEGTPDEPVKSANYTADVVQACVDSMSAIVPCGALIPLGSNAFDGNVSDVVGQGNGMVCSVDDNKALVAASKSCVVAACRYDESAWEAETHSALTQAIVDVVASSGTEISYLDLIDKLRDDVQNQPGSHRLQRCWVSRTGWTRTSSRVGIAPNPVSSINPIRVQRRTTPKRRSTPSRALNSRTPSKQPAASSPECGSSW